MKWIQRHPIVMIVIGILGISLSAIFVSYSTAPSAVTATFRLLWTVLLLTPAVLLKANTRKQLLHLNRRTALLSIVSGIFLALHFWTWFESLQHTSVAASTTIVCTEVIWVSLGFCLFLKGRIKAGAILAIMLTLAGSVMIALADSTEGGHLWGDVLALLAAMAVAVYTLIGRVVRKDTSTTVYTYPVYLSCAVTLILISKGQGHSLFGYGWSPVLVGLLLAVFSTILGHSIFSWCLKYFSPSFVSASKLCEPVVAGLLAVPLFHQFPAPLQLAGGITVLAGVYYYSYLERNK